MASVPPVSIICWFFGLYFPSIVLQTLALFSPYWIKDNYHTGCFRGVLYNVKCPDNEQGIGGFFLGLVVIPLALMYLSTVIMIYFVCYTRMKPARCCAKQFLLGKNCLYPFAGLFGFVGCIFVGATFPGNTKGWGFYCSIVASCYTILQMCCCVICMDSYEEEKKVKSGNSTVCMDSSKVVRKVKEGNGTVQYINNSGGVVIIGQMIRHDQIQIDVGATREMS